MKEAARIVFRLRTGILFVLCIASTRTAWGQGSFPAPGQSISLLEAIHSTLSKHPTLQIQQAQININRGVQEQAAGAFDSLIQSNLVQQREDIPFTQAQQAQASQGGITATDQASNFTGYGLAFDKVLRNGIEITPAFHLNRTTDNILSAPGVNTSSLSLLVNLPLLRGRGRKVVAAQENAAATEVEASLFDLNQLVAQLMANTASSYWNLVAAKKALAIALDAENRGKTYLQNVQALIDADQVPRNDLNEVTANLAARSASRIAAQQQVTTARQQLALDMGMSAQQMLTVVDTADDFPNGEDQELPSNTHISLQYYLDEALQRRGDYKASQRRDVEARILVTAARNRLLPQLNLTFAAGYSGLREGRSAGDFFTSSTFSSVSGPNATAGINYTFPAGKHVARGQLLQAEASARQAELRSMDVARIISAGLGVVVEGLRNSILQVKQARQAVESFQAALAGEREKYRMGLGSIVDVLTTEDRLNTAMTGQVQAQLGYALALIQFRLATGTLISPGQAGQTVRPETFLTLPFAAAPQEQP